MADNDNASKTEQPTPKRLEQARERGQVAVSQDVKSWAMLAAGLIAIGIFAPAAARKIGLVGRRFIEAPEAFRLNAGDLQQALGGLIVDIGLALAPAVGVFLAMAIAGGIVQSGLIWAPTKIHPDPSKISPLSGAKRLFSTRALMEFAKSILKLAAVGAVCTIIARSLLDDMALLPAVAISALVERSYDVALWLLAGCVAVMTFIAGLDYAFQKMSFLKQQRMTKQEVRDEHKQSEGDPQIKARIRRIRIERARQRMMAAVPSAAVVITNPTHYAIALAYEMEAMAAPKVVAKGVDSLAQRIRTVAEENEVPIVENPPLARALYAAVDLDEEIPAEHYQAVAQVIGYVMSLKGRVA